MFWVVQSEIEHDTYFIFRENSHKQIREIKVIIKNNMLSSKNYKLTPQEVQHFRENQIIKTPNKYE